MAYLRIADEPAFIRRPSVRLGDLAWDTQFLPFARREGHEILTRNAMPADRTIRFPVGGVPRARLLSSAEIAAIIRGNQDVDIKYLRGARAWALPAVGSGVARALVLAQLTRAAVSLFSPEEQKHHALRRTLGQSMADALRDIREDLRRQHAGILAEPDPARRLARIGAALHLIQDAFSPAHIDRSRDLPGCVARVRNYGRGSALFRSGVPGPEHGVPSDHRDRVAHHPDLADAASRASRRYLQIAFKAIYGNDRGHGDSDQARREAAGELERFIADNFRLC